MIAANRNPNSYIAGATPLTRATARLSGDLDIFHDVVAAVRTAYEADRALLLGRGYAFQPMVAGEAFFRAAIDTEDGPCRIDWAQDTAIRFFPARADDELGWTLHPVDLAVNKVLAAAGRREARDIVDLLHVDATILPLGALAWAAPAKDPGWSPHLLLAEIARSAIYTQVELDALDWAEAPPDAAAISGAVKAGIARALELIDRLPTDLVGCLWLDSAGAPAVPDPTRPETLQHPLSASAMGALARSPG